MAIWIELRCEDRGGDNPDCDSDSNNDPGGLANDNQQSALYILGRVAKEAKACGWKKTKDGWICPKCAAIRKQNDPAMARPAGD